MIKHYATTLHSDLRHEQVDRESDTYVGTIALKPSKAFQTMKGFGGAFTEAAAYTLSLMPEHKRKEVLKAYFDPEEGLNYNLGRVHINSCDFSLENYTYVEENDTDLKSFDISREKQWVIPMIKDAEAVRGNTIELLASPWSPPGWMKTNGKMNEGGKLQPEYYQSWADYYVKFIDAFKEENLSIFAISVQNEPAAKQTWDSCIYTAEEERDFVKNYLGPTLEKSPHENVGIIVWDHNRDVLVERAKTIYDDQEAKKYVWGTGIHWYVSEAFENLSIVHDMAPDKHILFTEGCVEGGVQLQVFENGERYARNMIGDIQNYCEGYIDWNLTLNEIGGPNHVGNYCDAPIIADTQEKELHYNVSYYAIAHFSKHVRPGAKRIHSKGNDTNVSHVAFLNQDGSLVLVLQNETDQDETIQINIKGKTTNQRIEKRSISTIIAEV
ncbi:MAG: glycoside hydrolase family 30 protein [Bacillota bacterium]